MNNGGCVSFIEPIWYMGRFTNYMPDLSGKIQLTLVPAWEEGGMRTGVSGGTGTCVVGTTAYPELCKDLVEECLLTEEANIEFWNTLAFDPPMSSVWDDEALKEESAFTEYFLTKDLFGEVLSNVTDVPLTNVFPNFPKACTIMTTTVLPTVLENGADIQQTLESAQQELLAAQ